MLRTLIISTCLLCSPYLVADNQSVSDNLKIRLVTSQFAPLQYHQDSAKGYVIDLFSQLRPILKSKYKIELGEVEFYPWKRAIQIASNDKNTLFFSLSRTQSREKNFKWLTEVSPYKQAVFSLSDINDPNNSETLKSWQELIQSNRILAIQSGSQLENYVANELSMGENQLYPVPHYLIGIKMLFAGRIDYLPLTQFLANGTLCKNGYPSERLNQNFTIDKFANPLWAAFSLKTDEKLVNITRQEIQKISQSQWYKTHQEKVINDWNKEQCRNYARAN